MRYLARLQYDGTAYHGWQRQLNTPDTIQARVEDALAAVCCHPVTVFASGRTDVGVHALGQCAHFDTHAQRTPDQLLRGANHHLPSDIRIHSLVAVADDFHARYHAVTKTYEYRMRVGQPSVFDWRYVLMLPAMPDTVAMSQALGHLVGQHDFCAMMASGSSVRSTVRTITDARLVVDGDDITLRVSADGFLYNMVRVIVQMLLRVGWGKMSADQVPSLLARRDRSAILGLAPARGLCLLEVRYD